MFIRPCLPLLLIISKIKRIRDQAIGVGYEIYIIFLILDGIDSAGCWNHSSKSSVHVDMIASHNRCRFGPFHIHDAKLSFHHITNALLD